MSSSMDFDGKTAIITGSSGIALATALSIARAGAQVHLCGIDKQHNAAARDVADGLKITVHEIDVADEGQVQSLVDTVAGQTGGIDILVNSAGIQTYGDVESTDVAHWDRVMAINLRACFLTSHYVFPHMKKRGGGAIVHVSSVQGHANQTNVLPYSTTKGALHAMTRAMAVDCAKHNIRVNSISPGSIRTPLLEYGAQQLATDEQTVEDVIEQFGNAHPIGRVGTAEEVAALICFLVSDKGGFCAGADFRIDGGLTAHIGI